MQELEKLMTEFVEVTRKKYDGYAYPVGYLMSVIQFSASDDPKLADRLLKQFTNAIKENK